MCVHRRLQFIVLAHCVSIVIANIMSFSVIVMGDVIFATFIDIRSLNY